MHTAWAISIKEGETHPIVDTDIRNIANPSATPCIYVLYNWLLKKENDKWMIMSGVNGVKPPTEDIIIQIIQPESPWMTPQKRNAQINREMFTQSRVARLYPMKSTNETCVKCNNKADWLAFCYFAGKSTKNRIIPVCLNCTLKGESNPELRKRKCRICGGSYPDKHIYTKEDRFHLQIHAACIPALLKLPERETLQWKELPYNVIIKETQP